MHSTPDTMDLKRCVILALLHLLLLLNCGLTGAVPVAGDTNSLDDTALMASASDGGGGWFASATNALAAPAGQMAMHFAKEMISRSAGNSQPAPQPSVPPLTQLTPKTSTDILSLNLSNLLVLVLLKALIFAAGLMGAGNWGNWNYARSRSDDNYIFSNDDPPLMLGFLLTEGVGDDNCLRQAACQKPDVANEYVRAAKALLQGAQLTGGMSDTTSKHYQSLIARLEFAILDGVKGAQCRVQYPCAM